jgi:hypothetical protein
MSGTRRVRHSTQDFDAWVYVLQAELESLEESLSALERQVVHKRMQVQGAMAERWGSHPRPLPRRPEQRRRDD